MPRRARMFNEDVWLCNVCDVDWYSEVLARACENQRHTWLSPEEEQRRLRRGGPTPVQKRCPGCGGDHGTTRQFKECINKEGIMTVKFDLEAASG